MYKQAKLALAAVVSALALSPVSRAQAAAMLDFGIIAPTRGSISYNGSGGPLIGTNIEVDMVIGLGTALNNHVDRLCDRCTLSFTTGPLASWTPTSWSFAPGGSITLAGGVDLTGNGSTGDVDDIPSGTTLLTGTFIESPLVLSIGGRFKIAGALFTDRKDRRLLDFYGLRPDVVYLSAFNISFMAPGAPPGGFVGHVVLSGDIVNRPVSIPSSILLFASGLIGLFLSRKGVYERRRFSLQLSARGCWWLPIYLIFQPYSMGWLDIGTSEGRRAVRVCLHPSGPSLSFPRGSVRQKPL